MPQSIPNLSEEWDKILSDFRAEHIRGYFGNGTPKDAKANLEKCKAQLVKSLEGEKVLVTHSTGDKNVNIDAIPVEVIKEILE